MEKRFFTWEGRTMVELTGSAGAVQVVDELRDFDFEAPGSSPTIDYPDTSSPECARWDHHGVQADLSRCWDDDAGARWTKLLLSRKSGELFTLTARVRPLAARRPGERCLVRLRAVPSGAGLDQFWPCYVELDVAHRPSATPGDEDAAAR